MVGKKNNRIKLTDNQKRLIATQKYFFNDYVSRSVLADSVDYIEKYTEDGEYIFSSIIDYGKFKAKILYCPIVFLAADYVDVKIVYANCDYEFGIYDIFNLFDINDFEQYYYTGCDISEEMKIALNHIVKMLERYLSDIELAADEYHFSQLKNNFEQDITAVSGDDSWKTDTEDIMRFDFGHPINTVYEDLGSKNLLKKLQKRNDRGTLYSIYEKRLLAYLEGGNTLDLRNDSSKRDFDRQYGKAGFRINTVIVIVCIMIAVAVSIIGHICLYGGAYVPKIVFPVINKAISMNIDRLEMCIFACVALSTGIILLVKKAILVKVMPVVNQKRAAEKYENEKIAFVGSGKRAAIIGTSVLLILFSAAASYMSAANDIGFFDSHFRFFNERNLMLYTVDYNDAVLYRLKGFHDDNSNALIEYDGNAYAIGDKNGHFYEIGQVNKNGPTEEKINEIINRYNIDLVEIETTDDI